MPVVSDRTSIRTAEDAQRFLERFNAFHDGFIRELRLRSRDAFVRHGSDPWDIAHGLTGRFDAVVDFAHYNYGERPQPPDRIVRCRFSNVADFFLDLRGVSAPEWPIQTVDVETAERAPEHGHGEREPCFCLCVAWSALEDGEWTVRSGRLLTFEHAEVEELSDGTAVP